MILLTNKEVEALRTQLTTYRDNGGGDGEALASVIQFILDSKDESKEAEKNEKV